MWSFFNSFAASTKFEKYRLQITAKNYDSPNQDSLRNMVKTFCSEDPQTKAQIAFATIIKKLLTSDSRSSWVYLFKNLIILDRVIEEAVFIDEISQSEFDMFDDFKETDSYYVLMDSQRMIRLFWKLVHEKSHVLKTRNHIFCFKRGQRQKYLANLNAGETLKVIQSIQQFFAMAFELIDIFSGKRIKTEQPSNTKKIQKVRSEFTNSKLFEYFNLQMLHKLMLYYSCSMQCSNHILQLMVKETRHVRVEEIKKFRKALVKFKANADEFVMFVEVNKKVKGFDDINYRELNPYQKEEMLAMIDKWLVEGSKKGEIELANIDYMSGDQMKVEKHPSSNYLENQLIPRKKLRRPVSLYAPTLIQPQAPVRIDSNPFVGWKNSYSEQFPQKEIMTVDLITLLKQQTDDCDEQLAEVQRQPNQIFYDLRDTNITVNYQVALRPEEDKSQQVDYIFKNKYSGLPFIWNNS